VRRARGLCEKTRTHHAGTDHEDAEGDQQMQCVVVAVGSSATVVVVAPSAA
jgi:hypothetical protein